MTLEERQRSVIPDFGVPGEVLLLGASAHDRATTFALPLVHAFLYTR